MQNNRSALGESNNALFKQDNRRTGPGNSGDKKNRPTFVFIAKIPHEKVTSVMRAQRIMSFTYCNQWRYH